MSLELTNGRLSALTAAALIDSIAFAVQITLRIYLQAALHR